MSPISAGQLLSAWEGGAAQPAATRALTLVSLAAGGLPADAASRLVLGRRNALLLELRELIFGPSLSAVAPCPHCGTEVEATFDAGALRAQAAGSDEVHSLETEGYRLRLRLPDSLDLVAIDGAGTVE